MPVTIDALAVAALAIMALITLWAITLSLQIEELKKLLTPKEPAK